MAGFSDLVAASAESLLNQDLRVRAGSSWNRGWTFYDSADALVDFTGATAQLLIKDHAGGNLLATYTETLSGGRQIVLTNGTVALKSTAASTAGYTTTKNYDGVYELKVTKGSETVTLVSGKITIFPSV